MKRYSAGALFLLLTLIFQSSYASGVYVSINSGFSDINLTSRKDAKSNAIKVGSGYGVAIGTKITDHFSLEGFYSSANKTKKYKVGEIDGKEGDILDFINDVFYFGLLDTDLYADVDMTIRSFGVNAKYQWNMSSKTLFYLKAGASNWESELDITMPDSSKASDSDSGFGFNYGLGFKLNLGERWSLFIDLERFIYDEVEVSKAGIGTKVLF